MRAAPFLILALGTIGCGGGDMVAPPPTTVTVTPASLTLHSGELVPLSVATDRGPLPATRLTWTTGDSTVAVVTPNGFVAARAPGTTQITGMLGSLSGTVQVTIATDLGVGQFVRPLAANVATATVFDHDVPREFDSTFDNGYLLSYWGEKLGGIDGHDGYDWPVPVGTPVYAAGPGTVVSAGRETPFFCPLLNATVAGFWVSIVHGVGPGQEMGTQYGHFSRIDVQVGQHVAARQQIGLSGNTGCSTGPHLHFSAFRVRASDRQFVVFDPFGWIAATPDPWSLDTAGVPSVYIWGGTAAPAVFGEVLHPNPFVAGDAVELTRVRYLGVADSVNPDNEFAEVTVNPAATAPYDLSGEIIRNLNGDTFRFPNAYALAPGRTVRVYTGSGTDTDTTFYRGLPAGVWNDVADCAVLDDSAGHFIDGMFWGKASCSALLDGSANRVVAGTAAAARALDFEPPGRGFLRAARAP